MVVNVLVLVENVHDVLLFSGQQMPNFVYNVFSGSQVQVDERFHNLIAILILGDLKGK